MVVEIDGWPQLARVMVEYPGCNLAGQEVYDLTKCALCYVDDYSSCMLCQPLEEKMQVTPVLFGVGAGHENVVDVHKEELL